MSRRRLRTTVGAVATFIVLALPACGGETRPAPTPSGPPAVGHLLQTKLANQGALAAQPMSKEPLSKITMVETDGPAVATLLGEDPTDWPPGSMWLLDVEGDFVWESSEPP